MPKYFFNVDDGQSSPDEDGTELPDLAAAKVEGLRLAGAIIQEKATFIETGRALRIEVSDGTDLVLFRMVFSLVESPALHHGSEID